MKEIICTTQKEVNSALNTKDCIVIVQNTSETIYLYDNSTVRACGNATVTACGNSTVRAYGNATVTAYGNSTVRSYGNATVTAYGNATVTAHENSTVRAYGNATVTAHENSTVTAYDNSVSIEAYMFAVVIMIGCVCKIKKRQKSVTVIKNKIAEYTKGDFLKIYPADKNGDITLYKSVRDNNTDFYTGKIKYEGTVNCPDWDGDKNRQCGGGLHLSPLPEMALSYNKGKLLKCNVNKKDFVVFPNDITKVRCKKVTVIGEYTEGK